MYQNPQAIRLEIKQLNNISYLTGECEGMFDISSIFRILALGEVEGGEASPWPSLTVSAMEVVFWGLKQGAVVEVNTAEGSFWTRIFPPTSSMSTLLNGFWDTKKSNRNIVVWIFQAKFRNNLPRVFFLFLSERLTVDCRWGGLLTGSTVLRCACSSVASRPLVSMS